MDELFDADRFVFDFPLWTLVNPQAGNVILLAANDAGEQGPPFFTDRDLALRFREKRPQLADYVLAALDDHARFVGFLNLLEQKGHTHAVIDPDRRGWFLTIPELRGAAPNRPGPQNPEEPGG